MIEENEIFYTRQQELDVLLVELDRYLNTLTVNYETFENVQKDNRRELELKLDKHQVNEKNLFFAVLWSNFLLATISIDQRFRQTTCLRS